MSKQKGRRGESNVVGWFEEHGWYAQRTGGSGAGTSDARPDLIALKSYEGATAAVVPEVKSRGDGTVRLDKEEVYQLEEVAERSGAIPLVVVHPDLRSHDYIYAWLPSELKENKKSFTVTGSMIPGPSLEEQVEVFFSNE